MPWGIGPVRSDRRLDYRHVGDHRPRTTIAPGRDGAPHPTGSASPSTTSAARATDLLLVHATGFCAEVLRAAGPALLAGHYHCWGLDLRAHGRSDRPADGELRLVRVRHRRADRRRPPRAGPPDGLRPLVRRRRRPPGRGGPARDVRGRSTASSRWSSTEPVELGLAENNPLSAGPGGDGRPSPRPRTPSSTSRPSRRSATSIPRCCELYVEAGFELIPTGRGRRRVGHAAALPARRRGGDLRPRRLPRCLRPSPRDRLPGGLGLRRGHRRLRPVLPGGRRRPAADGPPSR